MTVFRPYDPSEPLVSLHIPKCGGQSLADILKKRFRSDFFLHYYQTKNALPDKVELASGSCIHGHFNRSRGFGVMDYYPGTEQFITFLRDPWERLISNYFYWLNFSRERQLHLGIIQAGGEHDYTDIRDFINKRFISDMLDFFPWKLTDANYKELIKNNFVFIGLVEDYQRSVKALSELIKFSLADVPHINRSDRRPFEDRELKKKYIESNKLVWDVYEYGKSLYYEFLERS